METKRKEVDPDLIAVEAERTAKTVTDVQRLRLERLFDNIDKPVPIPNARKERPPPKPPEFVRNVVGSSAGAGSAEYHIYRNIRKKEYARLQYIEQQAKKEEDDRQFVEKLQQKKQESQEKTAKKRAKRLKKKERAKLSKKAKLEKKQSEEKGGSGEKGSSGESEGEEFDGVQEEQSADCTPV